MKILLFEFMEWSLRLIITAVPVFCCAIAFKAINEGASGLVVINATLLAAFAIIQAIKFNKSTGSKK